MSRTFGGELRRLREARGLSLRALAGRVNLTYAHLSNLERGARPPTRESAQACAAELGEELVEFVYQQQVQAQSSAVALARPAQLPPVVQLRGRDEQLTQLSRAVGGPEDAGGAARVAALDGGPGVGKTSLAVSWGHVHREHYPDGQLFWDLRGWDPDFDPAEPAAVLEEFLRSLGIPSGLIPAEQHQREQLWRSVTDGLRLLIVLDNAHDSTQVLPLVPTSRTVTVLITSRARLSGLTARLESVRLPVATLPAQEARDLLTEIIGEHRGSAEPEAITELAARCDYLPLALRIAGEHVAAHPHRPLDVLASQLETLSERLDALDVAGEAMAGSLRAAFTWSYQDLNPTTAQVFRSVGLHPRAEVSTAAVAALVGVEVEQARRELDRLAATHLVEEVDRDRYRIHDLLRAYAAERSRQEDPPEWAREAYTRLVEWYLYSAAAANDPLAPQRGLPPLPPQQRAVAPQTFDDYDAALSWCEREAFNVVAVVELGRRAGLAEQAWTLAVVNWNYYYLTKHWSPWLAAHRRGLAAAADAGDTVGQAWCLHNLGAAYTDLRRWPEALESLDEAIRLRRDAGDDWGLGWSLFAAGAAALEQGRPDVAAGHLAESLTAFDTIAFDYGRAAALALLGTARRRQGSMEQAMGCLRQSLELFTSMGAADGEPFARLRLAACYIPDQPDLALNHLDDALAMRAEQGDHWGHAEIQISRGHALHAAGKMRQARDAWQAAAELFDALHDPRGQDARALLDGLDDDIGDVVPDLR